MPLRSRPGASGPCRSTHPLPHLASLCKALSGRNNGALEPDSEDLKAAAAELSAQDRPTAWSIFGLDNLSGLLSLFAWCLLRSREAPVVESEDLVMVPAHWSLRNRLVGDLRRVPLDRERGYISTYSCRVIVDALLCTQSLRCYSALLAGAANSEEPTGSSGPAPSVKLFGPCTACSLLTEVNTLLEFFRDAGDWSMHSLLAAELTASSLLDHWAQTLLRLVLRDEARAATLLHRMGGLLHSTRAHRPFLGDRFILDSPCLSYLLSSHLVGICAALDGGPMYGMPAGPGAEVAPVYDIEGKLVSLQESNGFVALELAQWALQRWCGSITSLARMLEPVCPLHRSLRSCPDNEGRQRVLRPVPQCLPVPISKAVEVRLEQYRRHMDQLTAYYSVSCAPVDADELSLYFRLQSDLSATMDKFQALSDLGDGIKVPPLNIEAVLAVSMRLAASAIDAARELLAPGGATAAAPAVAEAGRASLASEEAPVSATSAQAAGGALAGVPTTRVPTAGAATSSASAASSGSGVAAAWSGAGPAAALSGTAAGPSGVEVVVSEEEERRRQAPQQVPAAQGHVAGLGAQEVPEPAPRRPRVPPSKAVALALDALACAREAMWDVGWAPATEAVPPPKLRRLERWWQLVMSLVDVMARWKLTTVEDGPDRGALREALKSEEVWGHLGHLLRLRPQAEVFPTAPSLDVATALSTGYLCGVELLVQRRGGQHLRSFLENLGAPEHHAEASAWGEVLAFAEPREVASLIACCSKRMRHANNIMSEFASVSLRRDIHLAQHQSTTCFTRAMMNILLPELSVSVPDILAWLHTDATTQSQDVGAVAGSSASGDGGGVACGRIRGSGDTVAAAGSSGSSSSVGSGSRLDAAGVSDGVVAVGGIDDVKPAAARRGTSVPVGSGTGGVAAGGAGAAAAGAGGRELAAGGSSGGNDGGGTAAGSSAGVLAGAGGSAGVVVAASIGLGTEPAGPPAHIARLAQALSHVAVRLLPEMSRSFCLLEPLRMSCELPGISMEAGLVTKLLSWSSLLAAAAATSDEWSRFFREGNFVSRLLGWASWRLEAASGHESGKLREGLTRFLWCLVYLYPQGLIELRDKGPRDLLTTRGELWLRSPLAPGGPLKNPELLAAVEAVWAAAGAATASVAAGTAAALGAWAAALPANVHAGAAAAALPQSTGAGLAPSTEDLRWWVAAAGLLMPPSQVRAALPTCDNPACTRLQGESEAAVMLSRCGRCGEGARYCCRECQVAHWRAGHSKQCAGAAAKKAGG